MRVRFAEVPGEGVRGRRAEVVLLRTPHASACHVIDIEFQVDVALRSVVHDGEDSLVANGRIDEQVKDVVNVPVLHNGLAIDGIGMFNAGENLVVNALAGQEVVDLC